MQILLLFPEVSHGIRPELKLLNARKDLMSCLSHLDRSDIVRKQAVTACVQAGSKCRLSVATIAGKQHRAGIHHYGACMKDETLSLVQGDGQYRSC